MPSRFRNSFNQPQQSPDMVTQFNEFRSNPTQFLIFNYSGVKR